MVFCRFSFCVFRLWECSAYRVGSGARCHGVCQQVLGQIDVMEACNAIVIQQWCKELRVVQPLLVATGEVTVATAEVDSRHILVGKYISITLLALSKDSVGIEVCCAHFIRAEVSRCTIYAVAPRAHIQKTLISCNGRWQVLMRDPRNMTIVQALTEEQVVIGPDGNEVG